MNANASYWSVDAGQLLRRLDSRIEGLDEQAAGERLRRDGPNTVRERDQATAGQLLLRQVSSPLVLILFIGAALSLVLRDWTDAGIILVIVGGSVLLGFFQEYRASTAVAELRRHLALTVRARRGGQLRTVPAAELVAGDVIELSAGSLVPADCVLLEGRDFLVSEAALTGEAFPVEKQPGALPPETPLAARSNCLYFGTSVRSGTATALVVLTGRATAFGHVAASLQKQAPETRFTRDLRKFGHLLLQVMVVTVVFVIAVNAFLGRPTLESLLFAVALAVGLSPELLPAIVSVTLSHGARALARRGVIVRRLEAIENLGSMDVLCTDKTGTLTAGVVELSAATDPVGSDSATVRQLAYLNAAFETGIANPIDTALVAAGQRDGLATAGYRKIDEIPYDFLRKRLTIVLAAPDLGGEHLVITKGAVSNVLEGCSSAAMSGVVVPLAAELRARIDEYFERKSSEGFRVLAVATKRGVAKAHYDRSDESDLTFAGFLLFFDPPKPDTLGMIRELASLGVGIKVITGDNRHVAAHVAASIGLDPQALLTGAELAASTEESLWRKVMTTDLFVEVDPQQKERIVRALQKNGKAVGFLGDGINDAPALHVADVGISVAQAVDVARESADIVLLKRDLDVLCRGVLEGRRTVVNTLKYVCITTSANFGNMMSMALATPFLPFLPLAAKQILLNNFLSDVPSVTVATDNVDLDRLARPERWRIEDVRRFMIVFGLVSSAFDILTFVLLLQVLHADETTFQTVWFMVSLLTELAVVLVLRTRRPCWRSRPGKLLLVSTVVVGALAYCTPYIGPLAAIFGFRPLAWPVLGLLTLVVLGYVVVTELVKLRYFAAGHRT